MAVSNDGFGTLNLRHAEARRRTFDRMEGKRVESHAGVSTLRIAVKSGIGFALGFQSLSVGVTATDTCPDRHSSARSCVPCPTSQIATLCREIVVERSRAAAIANIRAKSASPSTCCAITFVGYFRIDSASASRLEKKARRGFSSKHPLKTRPLPSCRAL